MKHDNSHFSFSKNITVYIFTILVILRLALSNSLPAYLLPGMPHDDGWMFDKAQHILKGEWLGPYDCLTLIKGVFSPLLLAICASIGVGFNFFNSAMYCLACIIFVLAVRPIIKSSFLQVTCLAFLLFNPISFAFETGQRVYRCGIGQWQIILIFSGIIAILFRRNDKSKKLLIWALVSGLALGSFILTREDGMWIFPIVLCSIFMISVMTIRENKNWLNQISVILLILVIPLLFRGAVALTNYKVYGEPIINDRSGGFYTKVAADLNLIKPINDEETLYRSNEYKHFYYTIYVSTMELAFAASPTLNSAAEQIRESMHDWINISQSCFGFDNKKNGQMSTDHILFALRDGVMKAGHYNSLTESEAFFSKVHNELQESFKNGALTKRGWLISPLISPLQDGDLVMALSLIPSALINVAKFNGICSAAIPSVGSSSALKEFGLFAGANYLPPTTRVFCSGWAFAKNNSISLQANLYENQQLKIKELPFSSSADVFIYFQEKYQNANCARFQIDIEVSDPRQLVMKLFDKKANSIKEIPINGSSLHGDDDSFAFHIDRLNLAEQDFYHPFVSRANYVVTAYQAIVFPITILALVFYFCTSLLMIKRNYKSNNKNILPAWLVMSGMLFTLLLFLFGMSIITTTSFNALSVYLYTAPAYVLLLMFCAFSVCWGLQTIIDFSKRGVL